MSGGACCPNCGSAAAVEWKGREGDGKNSRDLWQCTADGRQFSTPTG